MHWVNQYPSEKIVSKVGRSGEDRYVSTVLGRNIKLYGVFDGHGGSHISTTLASELPNYLIAKFRSISLDQPSQIAKAITSAFLDLDRDMYNAHFSSGSTASLALVIYPRIYLINLGDSKAMIFTPREGILKETEDHKPGYPSEKIRIERLGGIITHDDTYRVNGELAVSRSFGDFSLKRTKNSSQYDPQGWVSVIPDIYCYTIQFPHTYILLASDGLWDNFSPTAVKDFILTHPLELLVNQAADKTTDDVTILLVKV